MHGWAVPAGVVTCPQQERARSISAFIWLQNEQPQFFLPRFFPLLDLHFASISCFIKVSSVSKVSGVLKKDCLHDTSSQGAKGEDILHPNVMLPAITGSVHGDAPFLTNRLWSHGAGRCAGLQVQKAHCICAPTYTDMASQDSPAPPGRESFFFSQDTLTCSGSSAAQRAFRGLTQHTQMK